MKIEIYDDRLHYGREAADHPMMDKQVRVISGRLEGRLFLVKGWVDKVFGERWKTALYRNSALLMYILRRESDRLPLDDKLVYGKIDGWPYVVHASELSL